MEKSRIFILAAIIFSYSIHVFAGTVPRNTGVKASQTNGCQHLASSGTAGRETEAEKSEKPSTSEGALEGEKTGKPEIEKEMLFLSAATGSNAATAKSDEEFHDDIRYHVSFPATTHASLDPGDVSGKGQVFSEQYKVENYGNTDIVITIKNIRINWDIGDSYEIDQDEITASPSSSKKLNINMIWRNEANDTEKAIQVLNGSPNESVLRLKAADYNKEGEYIRLHKGGTGFFYFTGSLNADPNIDWENYEIRVCFDYEIISDKEEDAWMQALESENNQGNEKGEAGNEESWNGRIDF